MARVNPPLPDEHAQYNPVNRVTGLFDGHDAVTLALQELEAAGFASDDIDVFAGAEGGRALDPSGDEKGRSGRWFRKVEAWVFDLSQFHDHVAATLNAGGFVVAVRAQADDARKDRAMAILTRHGARDVKYWNNLYVEQGYEDSPQ